MRIAIVVAVVVCLGCKDNQTEQKPGAGSGRETQLPSAPPKLRPLDVKTPAFVPVTKLAATVRYTQKQILVDDQPVIEIGHDGMVDPKRLDVLGQLLEDKVRSDDPVGLAVDPDLPYFRLGPIFGVLRTRGFRNLALLAGNGSTMIPIELADSEEVRGLRLVVTHNNGDLVLWSQSGEEGNMQKPKLKLNLAKQTSYQPLTDALVEIVQRRWPDGARPPEDRAIVVQMGGMSTVNELLRVVSAVRVHGTLQLFPVIYLGSAV